MESVSYMHDNNIIEKKGAGLPVVYAIATSTEREHGKRKITTHNVIYEQGIDSYCWQAYTRQYYLD